jgi:hypothetical protein
MQWLALMLIVELGFGHVHVFDLFEFELSLSSRELKDKLTESARLEKESRAVDFPPPAGAHKKAGDGGMPEAGQVIRLR